MAAQHLDRFAEAGDCSMTRLRRESIAPISVEAKPLGRGTGSSNPAPSSGESATDCSRRWAPTTCPGAARHIAILCSTFGYPGTTTPASYVEADLHLNQIVRDEAPAADIGAKMSSIIPQWRHRRTRNLPPQYRCEFSNISRDVLCRD